MHTAGMIVCLCVDTHLNISHLTVKPFLDFLGNTTKNSPFSLHVSSLPAPCVPRNALGRLDCVTNSAWVTWEPSAGTSSYVVMAQEAQGHNSSCISSSSPCNVPDLKCGATYTFHITAVNRHCSSNHSESFEIETGMEEVCECRVKGPFDSV